jgi:coenzyme F420-reducing hydrogenase delta subunit
MRRAASASLAFLITACDPAPSVKVKYQGEVSLGGMECQAETQSTFIERYCYRRSDGYLIVTLKGTNYQYCGMAESVYAAWRRSESRGRFFNAEIKGRYSCR